MQKITTFFVFFVLFFLFFPVYSQNKKATQKQADLLEKIAISSGQEKSGLLFELGKTYLPNNSKQAKNYFLKALKLNPAGIKPDIYLYLSEIYVQEHNLDSMSYYINKGVQTAIRENNLALLAKLYYRKGDYFYYKNNYKEADRFYTMALTKAKETGDYRLVADILVDRAYLFEYWSKREKALQLLDKAVFISDSIRYRKGSARASLLLGNIYHGLNKENKALEYYQKTYEIAREIQNHKGMGISLTNIGMSYYELKKYDMAIPYLNKAIINLKKIGDVPELYNIYELLALIYSKKKNAQKALEYADKSIALIRKTGNKEELLKALNSKAEVLMHLHRYALSNKYLDTCINVANQSGFGLMLQKSYESYADNLQKMGQHDQAYTYLRLHNKVKDSLLSDSFEKRLADFETKYKTLEKQRKIEQLENKQRLQKTKLMVYQLAGGGLLLIFVSGGFFLHQKRKKEKEIARLELEKSQLKSKQLAEQLELKNRQLTTHALNMMQKNKLLNAFSDRIVEIEKISAQEVKQKLKRIRREINHLIHSEEDWDTFKSYFEQVNKEFLDKIKKVNPDLTQNDLRLAALCKLNMSNKEIASILNITHQSVKNALYRLKNKLDLESGTDLKEFIINL